MLTIALIILAASLTTSLAIFAAGCLLAHRRSRAACRACGWHEDLVTRTIERLERGEAA